MKYKKLIPVAILIITLLIFNRIINKCGQDKIQVVNNYDSLQIKNIELQNQIAVNEFNIKQFKLKTDSLESVKSKVVIRYKSIKDTIIKYYASDTVIMEYTSNCDSIINLDTKIIHLKDSTINSLESTILLKDFQLTNKDVEIDLHLQDKKDLTKKLKKQKLKTIGVGILGAIGLGALFLR